MTPSAPASAPAQREIAVAAQPLYDGGISPLVYGDFIEFVNDLISGMRAEKLEDRSFEGITQPRFVYPPGTNWVYPRWRAFTCGLPDANGPAFEREGDLESLPNVATFELDLRNPYAGRQSARVTVGAGDGRTCFAGIEQAGIAVRAGQRLTFEMYVRTDGADPGPVRVVLGRNRGVFCTAYAQTRVAAVPRDWTRFSAELVSNATDEYATLSIGIERPGTFHIDQVSLMPDDNVLGWRRDVVEAVRALRPGIIRFGGSSLIYYDWQSGLAPRDRRAAFVNHPWENTESHDVGVFEFLQFCELVGAEPLICTNANSASTDSILNEIEFCNGPSDSPYGRRRAALGHAEPFRVQYWQIGNEQAGEEYERRLRQDAHAIRARYPTLQLLASYPSDRILDELSDAVDFVCPHLYEPCTRAMEDGLCDLIAHIAARARNKRLKIGVTEWNLTGGAWGWGRAWLATQACALNAARMFQMFQRLGDAIRLANRSNLTNSCLSGVLQTGKAGLYVTPTYHVQRAFATYSGDVALPVRTDADETLHAAATRRSADGELAVSVVNPGGAAEARGVDVSACGQRSRSAQIWTLAARSLLDVNDWAVPARVAPIESAAPVAGSRLTHIFPPHSVTILRIARA